MKRVITWYLKTTCLHQAIASGLEFAFLSRDNKQCCPFVLCKDYLQDAIYNQIYKTKKKIYGFQYDAAVENPISLTKTRLLIANSSDKNLRDKIVQCIDFINQIEEKLNMPRTKYEECDDPPLKYKAGGVWLFESNRRWLISPPMISMYSLLIRVGMSHTTGKDFWNTINSIQSDGLKSYQYEDTYRLKYSTAGIKRILDEGDREIFYKEIKKNYPKGTKINTLHNDLGICGFSSGATKYIVPYWHRKELEVN